MNFFIVHIIFEVTIWTFYQKNQNTLSGNQCRFGTGKLGTNTCRNRPGSRPRAVTWLCYSRHSRAQVVSLANMHSNLLVWRLAALHVYPPLVPLPPDVMPTWIRWRCAIDAASHDNIDVVIYSPAQSIQLHCCFRKAASRWVRTDQGHQPQTGHQSLRKQK